MLLLGTSEERAARNQANEEKVSKWFELQRQAIRDGQAAFLDFNEKYYETCRQKVTSPRTKDELDTQARKSSAAQLDTQARKSSAAQTEPHGAPPRRAARKQNTEGEGGSQRWQ